MQDRTQANNIHMDIYIHMYFCIWKSGPSVVYLSTVFKRFPTYGPKRVSFFFLFCFASLNDFPLVWLCALARAVFHVRFVVAWRYIPKYKRKEKKTKRENIRGSAFHFFYLFSLVCQKQQQQQQLIFGLLVSYTYTFHVCFFLNSLTFICYYHYFNCYCYYLLFSLVLLCFMLLPLFVVLFFLLLLFLRLPDSIYGSLPIWFATIRMNYRKDNLKQKKDKRRN